MKKAEIILLFIIGLTVGLGYTGWDGTLMLMMVTLFTLSFVYMIGGFLIFHPKKIQSLFKTPLKAEPVMIFLSVVAGLSTSVILVGILFEMLNWEGSQVMLITGCTILALVAIAALIFRKSGPAWYRIGMLVRSVFFIGLALFVSLVSNDEILEEMRQRHEQEFRQLQQDQY